MKSFSGLVLALIFALPANAQFEDTLWVANRGATGLPTKLTKVSACGELQAAVPYARSARSVNRAPDGKLWVVNFSSARFTILDRNGANPLDVIAGGAVFAIVFDKSGNAWMTVRGNVEKYTPAGVLIKSFTMPAIASLGLSIDQGGNVWVAHRVGPPGVVSRIDGQTEQITSTTLPATSLMLPVEVVTDFQGLVTPSHVWVAGDRSNELIELDNVGAILNTYPILNSLIAASPALRNLTVDGNNDIWVTTVANRLFRVDSNTGLHNPNPGYLAGSGGVSIDSFGRPWVAVLKPFSGAAAAESELRRFDPVSGAFETTILIGGRAQTAADANGFHFALVVDALGDADQDGVINFIEAQNGTSPYDPQSNARTSIVSKGNSQIGSTITIEISGATGSTAGLAIGFNEIPGIVIPAWSGKLLLDPSTIVLIIAPISVPASRQLMIPNLSALIGQVARLQALHDVSGRFFLSNLTCVAPIN